MPALLKKEKVDKDDHSSLSAHSSLLYAGNSCQKSESSQEASPQSTGMFIVTLDNVGVRQHLKKGGHK